MDMYQAALVAALVFTVPGFLLGWLSGLKAPWALAAAIPVSFGVYGLAAWLLGRTSQEYTLVSVTVVWALFMFLALFWRLAFRFVAGRRGSPLPPARAPTDAPAVPVSQVDGEVGGGGSTALSAPTRTPLRSGLRQWWRGEGRRGSLFDHVWLLPALGSLTGMYLFISRGLGFFEQVPRGIENIVQGWDVHWHASVIRWIGESGVADPTRMGELRNIETGASLYYPTGWHAGTYLIVEAAGVSPIAALNIASIVLPGMALPLSVGLIAWRMIGNRCLSAQIAAGIAAIAVVASPVLFWIGYYVGAWPYTAAIAVSGIVLALFMHVPHRPPAMLAAALALAGMTQMHPAAATIVVMGLGLWWLLYLLWAPARRARTRLGGLGTRLRDLGLLAAAGIGGVLIMLPQLLSGSETTEEVAAYTAVEDVTHAEAWQKSFLMHTRHTDAFPDVDPALVLWLAGIGALALILWRRNLWAPVFYLIGVWMTANSLQPFAQPWNELLDIVASLHYSTAHRLIMPVAMFVFAAAGVGVAVLIRLLTLAPLKKWATGSALLSVPLALLAGWGTAAWATRDEVMDGADWSVTAPRHDDRMVSEVDLRAFDWLADQPHAYDGLIMGEPPDGHGWMYAYNGLPSVMRHYTWPTTGTGGPAATATDLLNWHPGLIGAGNNGDPRQTNDVDTAAEELGVNFFFLSPGNFWHFQDPNLAMLDGVWQAPGMTTVYRDHNVTIVAVNQAFTDAELMRMRAPGNSPEPLPDGPTKGELGITTDQVEAAEPYFHRPTLPDSGQPDAPVEEPTTAP